MQKMHELFVSRTYYSFPNAIETWEKEEDIIQGIRKLTQLTIKPFLRVPHRERT